MAMALKGGKGWGRHQQDSSLGRRGKRKHTQVGRRYVWYGWEESVAGTCRQTASCSQRQRQACQLVQRRRRTVVMRWQRGVKQAPCPDDAGFGARRRQAL